ncbi:hypothetical protein L1887_30104 [Cichorium endivia]|nr:hypothetical protein L1887_30104 [Cichorium endivia]
MEWNLFVPLHIRVFTTVSKTMHKLVSCQYWRLMVVSFQLAKIGKKSKKKGEEKKKKNLSAPSRLYSTTKYLPLCVSSAPTSPPI